jgi:hypothetical protein
LSNDNYIEPETWLFVFVKSGRVVRGSYVGPDARLNTRPGSYGVWGPDVRVEPDPSEPGWLTLVGEGPTAEGLSQ